MFSRNCWCVGRIEAVVMLLAVTVSLLTSSCSPPRPAPQSMIPAATSMPHLRAQTRHPATVTVIDHEG